MSLSSAVNRNDYQGTGALNEYDYTFFIFAESHLEVKVRDDEGEETTLTLNTDYTVDGAGDSGGGSITLVDADQAWLDSSGYLDSDYALSIQRVVPITQTTSIRNQGAYFAEVHEDAFDKLTMIDQQQQDEIGRSLKAPASEDEPDMEIPAVEERKGKFLFFDTTTGAPTVSDGGLDDSIAASSFGESLVGAANAAAARTLLDVDRALTNLSAGTTIALDDYLKVYDTSATAPVKMTPANFLKVIPLLPSHSTPLPGDSLAIYDSAGTASKHVLLSELGAASYKAGSVSNLGFARATTTVTGDSIRIQGATANLASTNPLKVVIPNATTAGLLTVLTATANVDIKLTGAHWGLGTNGDFSNVELRVYAINDAGTLKWGVSNKGGLKEIADTAASATQTDINTQPEMLVNSTLTSGTWPCVEVGYFLASFDDTGGAAEDLWNVSTTGLYPGQKPQVNTDWATATLTCALTGGTTTVTAQRRRFGDNWEYKGDALFSVVFTGGSANFTLESGMVMAVGKLPSGADSVLGMADFLDVGTAVYGGQIYYSSSTVVSARVWLDDQGASTNHIQNNAAVTTTVPYTWANNDRMSIRFQAPFLGYSNN